MVQMEARLARGYSSDIKRWAKAEAVPIRYFKNWERKEAIAEPPLGTAAKEGPCRRCSARRALGDG